MKYFFYIEDEYASEFDCDFIRDTNEFWIDAEVRNFCKHLYYERDGWEWMKDSSERIVVIDENANARYFAFELEFEPAFFVTEVSK